MMKQSIKVFVKKDNDFSLSFFSLFLNKISYIKYILPHHYVAKLVDHRNLR